MSVVAMAICAGAAALICISVAGALAWGDQPARMSARPAVPVEVWQARRIRHLELRLREVEERAAKTEASLLREIARFDETSGANRTIEIEVNR